jgi:hypothetical protein
LLIKRITFGIPSTGHITPFQIKIKKKTNFIFRKNEPELSNIGKILPIAICITSTSS